MFRALEQFVSNINDATRSASVTGMYTSASCELLKPQTLNRTSEAGAIGARYEKTGLNFGFPKISST
jgi:hypothetical protein